MKKLRVGFLVDTLKPSSSVNELIEFVDDNESFDTPTLITGYKDTAHQSFIKKLVKKFKQLKQRPSAFVELTLRAILYRFILKIEIKKAKTRFSKYGTNADIRNLDAFKVVTVEGCWSKSNLFLEFTDREISLISSCNLDCIIRCGSGILKGQILDVTEFGVISFHHGDNRTNRGGPSGFWEVLHGEPSSGFIIQKLNQELDGGEVLLRGNMMSSNLWLVNNAQLLAKSNVFMMKLLLNLAVTRKLPKREGVRLHGNKLYKSSSADFIKYIFKIIVPKILRAPVSKLTSPYTKRWSVAYAYHNEFNKSLWRYKEISNPKGRFLADPFVIEHGGKNFIFVEDLFFEDNKGRISVIKVNDDDYDFLGVVLEEDFHLSFPFVFKEKNDIYMIPESCKNFDIRLYKCVEFPHKWKFEKQLMVDIDAADTMLFKNNDTWFMFTNICSAKINDHQSELHIFYSDHFKDGSWEPIGSGNPVIFDPLKGRNAGMFVHKGKIYRVNQVHGQDHYGKSFSVNEIVKISKDEFIERKVSTIEPNFKDSIVSTHHFDANASIAAVDFARIERQKSALKS